MKFRKASISSLLSLLISEATALKTICSLDGKMTVYFPYSRDARLVELKAGNCDQSQITQVQNTHTKDFTITFNPYDCGYLKPIKGNFSVETDLEFSVSLNTSPGVALIARKYAFTQLNCPLRKTYNIGIDGLTSFKPNTLFEMTTFQDASYTQKLTGASDVGDLMFFQLSSEILDRVPSIKYAPTNCRIRDRRSGRGFVLYEVAKNICERTELSFKIDWSESSWRMQYKMVMFRTSYAKYSLEFKATEK